MNYISYPKYVEVEILNNYVINGPEKFTSFCIHSSIQAADEQRIIQFVGSWANPDYQIDINPEIDPKRENCGFNVDLIVEGLISGKKQYIPMDVYIYKEFKNIQFRAIDIFGEADFNWRFIILPQKIILPKRIP